MVNNSIRPDMITNKWAGGIISMRHNAVLRIVALDVEIENNGYTMINTYGEGSN